jgi:hypothetical protein
MFAPTFILSSSHSDAKKSFARLLSLTVGSSSLLVTLYLFALLTFILRTFVLNIQFYFNIFLLSSSFDVFLLI